MSPISGIRLGKPQAVETQQTQRKPSTWAVRNALKTAGTVILSTLGVYAFVRATGYFPSHVSHGVQASALTFSEANGMTVLQEKTGLEIPFLEDQNVASARSRSLFSDPLLPTYLNVYEYGDYYLQDNILPQADGTVFTIMSRSDYESRFIGLQKSASNGDVIWQKTLTLSKVLHPLLNQAQNGDLILTGQDYDQEHESLFVFRLTHEGKGLWGKKITIPRHAYVSGVFAHSKQILEQNIYLVGGIVNGAVVIQLDASGNIQNSKKITFLECDEVHSASFYEKSNGNILIAGWTRCYVNAGFILELNSQLNVVHSSYVAGQNKVLFRTLIQSSDGGYIVSGTNKDGVCLMKFKEDHSFVWAKRYNNVYGVSNRLTQSTNGNLAFFGQHSEDGVVLVTKPNGDFLWGKKLDSCDITSVSNENENVYLTGGNCAIRSLFNGDGFLGKLNSDLTMSETACPSSVYPNSLFFQHYKPTITSFPASSVTMKPFDTSETDITDDISSSNLNLSVTDKGQVRSTAMCNVAPQLTEENPIDDETIHVGSSGIIKLREDHYKNNDRYRHDSDVSLSLKINKIGGGTIDSLETTSFDSRFSYIKALPGAQGAYTVGVALCDTYFKKTYCTEILTQSTLTVANKAPTLTVQYGENKVFHVGDSVMFQVRWTDPDKDLPLTFSIAGADWLRRNPYWNAEIDRKYGVYRGGLIELSRADIGPAQLGLHTMTLTVSDGFDTTIGSINIDVQAPLPTPHPSVSPTIWPTLSPSLSPIWRPTFSPTRFPTMAPTFNPSQSPTTWPTQRPSLSPIGSPSFSPTRFPTMVPTFSPSQSPTVWPTQSPSLSPIWSPSFSPTRFPTMVPTFSPSQSPTVWPTQSPSLSPIGSPSFSPTRFPTMVPTFSPSQSPTVWPTQSPSLSPIGSPSFSPTSFSTMVPTFSPSQSPTVWPTQSPSLSPIGSPTFSSTASHLMSQVIVVEFEPNQTQLELNASSEIEIFEIPVLDSSEIIINQFDLTNDKLDLSAFGTNTTCTTSTWMAGQGEPAGTLIECANQRLILTGVSAMTLNEGILTGSPISFLPKPGTGREAEDKNDYTNYYVGGSILTFLGLSGVILYYKGCCTKTALHNIDPPLEAAELEGLTGELNIM